MAYEATIYCGTGFNAVNIPDSPALLASSASVTLTSPTLDIIQDGFLSYIRIKVTGFAQVQNADYAKVGDYYYFVQDILMTSSDVAQLSLVLDYITTYGGVKALTANAVLDGITSRVHVTDDEYGKYREADPYMVPTMPLTFNFVRHSQSASNLTVVKSAMDLYAMGLSTASRTGLTYTDTTSGETVTVPQTVVNSDATTYTGLGIALPTEERVCLFDCSNSVVQKGLQIANDLGITGAVSAQVTIPQNLIDVTYSTSEPGKITKLASTGGTFIDETLTFTPYSDVTNLKIQYSDYTPYVTMSSSGDVRTFLPYELYTDGASQPTFDRTVDPRVDGKAYFYPQSYHGSTDDSIILSQAVESPAWREAPLVYEGASGKALSQLSANQARQTYEQDTWKALNEARSSSSQIKSGWNALGNSLKGSFGDLAYKLFSGLDAMQYSTTGLSSLGASVSLTGQEPMQDTIARYNAAIHNETYAQSVEGMEDAAMRLHNLDMLKEQQNLFTSTQVYTPTVQFSYASDLYTDLFHYPFIVLRYKYHADDVKRIDKILTMYGYKVTRALVASDFTSRTDFNYVQAGVTVGGSTIPKWMADGISVQLSGGVRIWHVKPSASYYS